MHGNKSTVDLAVLSIGSLGEITEFRNSMSPENYEKINKISDVR